MPLRTEIIDTRAGFHRLKREWDPLLRHSRADGFFLSWNYVATWHSIYEHRAALRLITARDGCGKLVGIAPMIAGSGLTRARRALRHLAFVGGLCRSTADYPDFIVTIGREDDVLPALCEAIFADLRGDFDLMHLSAIREGSLAARSAEIFRDLGAAPRPVHPRPSPYLTLPSSWEELLATKSKNFRKKLRHPANRITRELGAIEVHTAGVEIDLAEAMDALIHLNRQRWGKAGRAFHTGRFVQLHRRLAATLAEQGDLSLKLLSAGGRYIAAQHDFLYGGKAWGFQSGWLPQLSDYAAGRVLLARCIQDYIADGLIEYDFLPGAAEYKQSWGTGERRVFDLEMPAPSSLRGRAFAAARALQSALAS